MTTKQKRKGSGFEDRIVRDAHEQGLDARKQPGSGVYKDFPHDVVVEDLLAECKAGYTVERVKAGKTFQFQLSWLDGVVEAARKAGKRAGVVFFRPDNTKRAWALMEENFFLELLRENKELRQ